jgi:hypothetical protein
MNKAKIILITIVLCAVWGGLTAFNVKRRGLANLYYRTTGVFITNGVGRILTYASLSPYRTFPTSITQNTVEVTMTLYASTTLTWVTIGGEPYTYEVVKGLPYPPFSAYDDEDQ